MATMPMGTPQAAAPQGGAADQQQQQPQANSLQTVLGRLAIMCRQIGTQNTVIQPEMQQAASALIAALQKSSQAAPGQAQPLQAPPQG